MSIKKKLVEFIRDQGVGNDEAGIAALSAAATFLATTEAKDDFILSTLQRFLDTARKNTGARSIRYN